MFLKLGEWKIIDLMQQPNEMRLLIVRPMSHYVSKTIYTPDNMNQHYIAQNPRDKP